VIKSLKKVEISFGKLLLVQKKIACSVLFFGRVYIFAQYILCMLTNNKNIIAKAIAAIIIVVIIIIPAIGGGGIL